MWVRTGDSTRNLFGHLAHPHTSHTSHSAATNETVRIQPGLALATRCIVKMVLDMDYMGVHGLHGGVMELRQHLCEASAWHAVMSLWPLSS